MLRFKIKLYNNTTSLFITNILSNIFRLVSNLLLARILFPEAFAIVGIIGSIFFVMELFSDLGFHAYIIRHREGNNKLFLDTLWTIRLIRGIFLTGCMAVISWPLANYIGMSEIQPAIMFSSLIFLITGIEPLSDIVSERKNNVAKPLYIDLLSYSISVVCMIIIANQSESYWALIAGLFIHRICRVIFGYVLYENSRYNFRIERVYIPEFLEFAKIIVPSSIITVILAQGDKMIIVKLLSLSEVGLYYIALNFSAAAMSIVITYPRKVLYPILAETFREKPEQLRIIFYQNKMRVLCGLSFLIGGLLGGADLFFHLLYDERYKVAGNYLSILLIHPILCTITYPAETCLIACGRIKVALTSNLLRLAWIAPASYLGYLVVGSKGIILAFSTIELLPMGYFLWKLSQENLLVLWSECLKLASALCGFIISYYLSSIIMDFIS